MANRLSERFKNKILQFLTHLNVWNEDNMHDCAATPCSRSCGCKLGAIHRNEKMSKRRAENARYKNQEIK